MRVEYNGVLDELPDNDDGDFELSRALLKQLKTLKAAIRKCEELGRRARRKSGA
jgi:hypothetical protein